MHLLDLLGSRLLSSARDLVAFEGPVAGRRVQLDVGATNASLDAIVETLECDQSPRPGPVGILSNHQIETYLAVLASVILGRPFIPLNPKFPASRLAVLLDLAGVDTLVTDSTSLTLALDIAEQHRVINLSELIVEEAGETNETWLKRLESAQLDPDGTAYTMFTSGSTGVPKGVPITYANLQSYVSGVVALIDFPRASRFSQFFDLSFDLSMHDIFVAEASWGTLVAPTAVDLLMPSAYVAREAIDIWFSVPLVGAQLVRAPRKQAFPGLARMLFCGEALPMETVTACRSNWLAPGGEIWNLYGPTEATIAITGANVTDSTLNRGTASIGRAFGASHVALFDDDCVTTQPEIGAEGELLLGGPQVFGGYSTAVSSPFLTDADGERWYRTGDLVRVAENGINFRGRIDSQVKYRGYRIELGEIETALRHRFDLTTVAVALVGEGATARLVAFYVAPEAKETLDATVLADELPPYMIPEEFFVVDSMPVNANNKIDRKKLVSRLGGGEQHQDTT